MKQILINISIIMLIGYASANLAADISAGKELSKAKGCGGCHGALAVSADGTSFPNLAGQKTTYIEKALKAYRDKTRQATLMNGMASGLSDEDIANLAAYYSSLTPCP